VFLSREEPRKAAFDELERWVRAYVDPSLTLNR